MNLSFYNGALGARMQQEKLNVIGNNVANVNTEGFKSKNAVYVLEQLRLSAFYAMQRQSVGVATAPVQKSVINDAGIHFSGHTEYFQEFADVERVVMMLATKTLRVALATTHLPLRDVADAITKERLHQVIDILIHDLKTKFKIF